MNVIGTDPLSSVVSAQITADVDALLTDSDLATTVYLRTPSVATMDPRSGLVAGDDVQDTVSGYLTPLSLRDATVAPYQIGDVRLLVMASDLTSTPTIHSAFREGSNHYSVVTVERDPLGIFYELVGRRTRT